MERILMIGCGGAGKSTLARALGEKLGLPVVHLDKLWWTGNWENVPLETSKLFPPGKTFPQNAARFPCS